MPKPEMTVPSASTAPVRAPANRVVQGLLFTGGAVLLALTVGEDRISFFWTPLILGLTYLVAAIVDGRSGATGRRRSG